MRLTSALSEVPLARSSVAKVDRALADCERVIADGLRTFVEVGRALARIRDEELYKAEHSTFEAYCKARWDLSRPRAYQLIDSADIVSTMVDNKLPPPTNERQARELAKLPEAEQPEAWAEAVETAPAGVVTAKHVATVVAKRLPERKPPPPIEDVAEDFGEKFEALGVIEKPDSEPESAPRAKAPSLPPASVEDEEPTPFSEPPPGCRWRCVCGTWWPDAYDGACPECQADDAPTGEGLDEFSADESSTRAYRAVCSEIAAWPATESLQPLLSVLRQLTIKVEKLEASR